MNSEIIYQQPFNDYFPTPAGGINGGTQDQQPLFPSGFTAQQPPHLNNLFDENKNNDLSHPLTTFSDPLLFGNGTQDGKPINSLTQALNTPAGGLCLESGFHDQFPMPNLQQTYLDPMNLSKAMSVDIMQHGKQQLPNGGLEATQNAADDNQHMIEPFSLGGHGRNGQTEDDVIDDHLIDVESDSQHISESRSLWNTKQSKRNSSMKQSRGSILKGRKMLQTKNFMNMTMAQMVSDPSQTNNQTGFSKYS